MTFSCVFCLPSKKVDFYNSYLNLLLSIKKQWDLKYPPEIYLTTFPIKISIGLEFQDKLMEYKLSSLLLSYP